MREWRNWQTRTFKGRVISSYGFNSRLSHHFFAELCNGSTADSDSVCLGSNPSSAAKKEKTFVTDKGFFFSTKSDFVALVRFHYFYNIP